MNIRIFAYYHDFPMNLRRITVKKGKLLVEYIFFVYICTKSIILLII